MRRAGGEAFARWPHRRDVLGHGNCTTAINGVIIAKLKVPAFIVTLGSSFIVRGVALLMSENTTVIGLPPGIRAYGNDAIVYFVRDEGGGLHFLTTPEVNGELLRRMDRILTYPVVLTAIVVAIAIFVLRKTQLGRHTYAIGGNIEAAIRTGQRSVGSVMHRQHDAGYNLRSQHDRENAAERVCAGGLASDGVLMRALSHGASRSLPSGRFGLDRAVKST